MRDCMEKERGGWARASGHRHQFVAGTLLLCRRPPFLAAEGKRKGFIKQSEREEQIERGEKVMRKIEEG